MDRLLDSHLLIYAAAAVGACVGSFLNVCIYRMPRDLSINRPRRSFCPHCEAAIPWYLNIPVLSWIWLRGKCRACGGPIRIRYPLVELLTALLFFFIWIVFPWEFALVYWVFVSLCIAAAFIDMEHLIIPDEISLGGIVLGIAAAVAVPELMETVRRFHAVGYSIYGAFFGFTIIWLVITLGKLAFGRDRMKFSEGSPGRWKISQPDPEGEPLFVIGERELGWSDMFFRHETDRLRITGPWFSIDGKRHEKAGELIIGFDHCIVDGERVSLEDIEELEGVAGNVVIPREAMGYGDAKFMGFVGAFLGWKAVLFSIFAGSVSATLTWVILRLLGRTDRTQLIHFGPYLALGAVVWMFYGPDLLDWYLARYRWR